MRSLRARALGALLGAVAATIAAVEVPPLTGPFVDLAGMLTPAEAADVTGFLLDFDRKTEAQLGVLIVSTLDGEAIADYALRVFDEWKLGTAGLDSGALLVVSAGDREVAIQTGYGVEGTLTDAKCGRIIRSVVAPAFQQGDYGRGVLEALRNMAGVILEDETLVSPAVAEGGEVGLDLGGILFGIVFFAVICLVIARRSRRGRSVRGSMIPPIIYGGPRIGGGPPRGGGHFGGGGFSGGGGRSGGGGASGKW
jgi:uncharacterized protein